MSPWSSLFAILHWIGLALGAGAATAKLTLLLRCRSDHAFTATYLQVVRPLTRLIILGIILLTASGIGWLLLGYDFTSRLGIKVALVAAIWILGPVIDNVVEPRFRRVAPASGTPAAPVFPAVLGQYVAWEAVATLLFYVIIVLWTTR